MYSDLKAGPRRFLLLLFAFFALETRAQILSLEAWRGAGIGGLIGGILGHNSGRRAAEGIGIGAASGALLGSLTRERESYDTYIPSRGQSHYAVAPHGSHRPHHALTGAAVGAVTGGIIGHSSRGRTMEGVGIGAAGGAAIGALVEHAQRRRANRHYFAPEAQPRHSIVYHSNPPTTPSTGFTRSIHTREVKRNAIISVSQPSLETGSTLIRAVPDHLRKDKTTGDPRSAGVRFEYLGHRPKK